MNNKIKSILLVIVFLAIISVFTCLYFIKGTSDFSSSERRTLAQFPEVSIKKLENGKFMTDFESFSLDQFPARDNMRIVKSTFERFVLLNKVSNDLYYSQGHIASMVYPQDNAMLDYASQRFCDIYASYFEGKGKNIYFSLIPDKNAYLHEKAGVLSVNYDEFEEYMLSKIPSEMQYIDIADLIDADDFYYTDQHWRQEKIADVANALSSAMGNPLSDEYTEIKLDTPFYGTYYHQAAIPSVKPDSISYLTNETIQGCKVTILDDYGNRVESEMYTLKYAEGRDPYEIFLSGARGVIFIENPNADTDKELILFRDSFGSSLAPLLAEGYSKITICDTRYIAPANLADLVDFDSCDDVLFIYSTLIVDAATALKK